MLSNIFFPIPPLRSDILLILNFFRSLGLRAKMGAGYSRVNDLTIIQTTQVHTHVQIIALTHTHTHTHTHTQSHTTHSHTQSHTTHA